MYSQLENISSDIIKEFGLPCVVKIQSDGEYDPSTGEFKSTETERKAHCLFDNLAYDFNRSGQATSPMVQHGDVIIYVTSQGKPDVNAKIIAGGEVWSVITCQPIKPAGTVLIYQCQGRRVNNG